MDLSCPSCATTFRIDPEMIGPTGRSVRCGSCGHSWRQMRPVPAPPAPPTPSPVAAQSASAEAKAAPAEAVPAAPEKSATAPSDQGRAASDVDLARQQERVPRQVPPRAEQGGSGGWLTFFVVVAALAAIAYFGRDTIVQRVPQAAGLYALVGLGPAPIGDYFDLQVTHKRRLVEGQRELVIEGTIANLSVEAQPLPTLRARLTGADGTVIAQWDFEAEGDSLLSGDMALFRTSTRDPAREVVVEVLLIPGR